MKKIIPVVKISIICLIALTIYSCKKNSSSPSSGYYVSFKANGVQKQYTIVATGVTGTLSGGGYTASIIGGNAYTAGTEGFGINITNTSPVATGITYTDADVTIIDSLIPQVQFAYIDSSGVTYSSTYSGTPSITVNLSELNTTDIKGTFSGNVSTTSRSNTVSITDGQFVVKVP